MKHTNTLAVCLLSIVLMIMSSIAKADCTIRNVGTQPGWDSFSVSWEAGNVG